MVKIKGNPTRSKPRELHNPSPGSWMMEKMKTKIMKIHTQKMPKKINKKKKLLIESYREI